MPAPGPPMPDSREGPRPASPSGTARSAGEQEHGRKDRHPGRDERRVAASPAGLTEPGSRAAPKSPSVHRHSQAVAVADRENEEADEDPWMPAAPEPADPACLAESLHA